MYASYGYCVYEKIYSELLHAFSLYFGMGLVRQIVARTKSEWLQAMKGYLQYWGKADQEKKQWHPLVCHMLDVAAVTQAMMNSMPDFLCEWSVRLGISHKDLLDFIGFLACIHDLGKFSCEFQYKVPDLAQLLQDVSEPLVVGIPHTSLAWLLWNNHLDPQIYTKFGIENEQAILFGNTVEPLYSASFGHHGGPVGEPGMISKRTFGKIFSVDMLFNSSDLLDDLLNTFEGMNQLYAQPEKLVIHRKEIAAFSFILSGLIILADWTASATSNFPLLVKAENGQFSACVDFIDIESYFANALVMAKTAIERQGLVPVPKKRIDDPWQELFPNLIEANYNPSPLQDVMIHLHPKDEPALYVIEDLTGSGKTEAALILFSKLQAFGSIDGFYFALPTMATSNGMYSRIKTVYKKFFNDCSTPSLILAHGGSAMHKDFQDSIIFNEPNTSEVSGGTSTIHHDSQEIEYQNSQAACNEWLADRSRKVFLAQIGVGSIDQALLSVLYSKHNTLRMYGLSRKILILDEVHAYDLYMQRILLTLLQYMASQHRSVILLSATLPLAMKTELAVAYKKGLGLADGSESSVNDSDRSFPMVSIYHKKQDIFIPVKARSSTMRTVYLSFFTLPTDEEPIAFLKNVSTAGRCGVWIRNTVKDAQTAYENLTDAIGPDNVLLFHSRYTMQDRQVLESKILEIFGRKSGNANRAGKILIATQVVEQSLDLDFDEMITDLSPIDLVIQRAGRLKRHIRDKFGNLMFGGDDERGVPVLHIYGPSAKGDISSQWYSDFFPGGAFVYNDPGILWRTAIVLEEERALVVPEKSRYLIESVYGQNGETLPESLKEASGLALKKSVHNQAVAEFNVFPLFDGFIKPSDTHPWPDSSAPTRLTDDVATYRLCVYENNWLLPLAEDEHFPWQMSEVKYRKVTINYDTAIITLITKTEKTLFDSGRGSVLLPLEKLPIGDSQRKIYRSIGSTNDGKVFFYDCELGLSLRNPE